MIRFRITVRTTGMHVKVPFESDKILIQTLFKELSSFEEKFVPKRGWVRQLKKTYATYNEKTNTYGIHRNHFERLIEFLKSCGVCDDEIFIEYVHASIGADIHVELKEGVAPKDYQVPILDFTCSHEPIKVLPLQMGMGKTFISLMTIVLRKKRAAAIMGAMHLDTWKKDAAKFWKDTSGIKIVRGAAQLKKHIADGRKGCLQADIFLISVNTLRDFLSEYEELGYSTYGCTPLELYEVLGVDYRITDEVHENLHFNFRHDIETNTRDCIYLSATIESDIPFINKLYQTIYPLIRRYNGLAWDAYTDVVAIGYDLLDKRKVRYKGPNGMYSHNVFEEWIMSDPQRLRRYLEFIREIIEKGFLSGYQPGMKLLIFFSSIKMCGIAAEYYGECYPQFTTTAYNGEHEDEVLHSHDIVCSTIGSSGTGKDVKGLRTVILTIGLKSREKNMQVMGRLRKLDSQFPGVDPTYYYLVCKDIPMHMGYHFTKKKLFLGKVKSLRTVNHITKI